MGKAREAELLAAAEVLGIRQVNFLDYLEGSWISHWTLLPAYRVLEHILEEQHRILWSSQTYYRAFSLVNGGRGIEHDLFEGLR